MRAGCGYAARPRACALAFVMGWCSLAPRAAHAHPFPAEPPAFDSDACIEVVDKREQESWHLDYRVPFEDTATDPDKIPLPDTKTHQFLAVAGHVRADAMGHAFLPFENSEPRPMPTWLTLDDVQRADAAADDALIPWSADMLSDGDVVENDAALWSSVLQFTREPRRVPITEAQGMQGADWDLVDVPAGVYQIVGYTFSPPYNAWAPRPGLLKVLDGSADPAVVTLRSVGANLFAGQGRRITGCVDAAEGSTVQIAVRNRGEADGTFETWLDEQPIVDGEYDVCLQNPGMDATLEVRVEVHTPEGETASAYGEEVIAMFATSAPCLKSETRCCLPVKNDTGGGPTVDGGASQGAGHVMDAGSGAEDEPRARDGDAGSDAPDASSGPPKKGAKSASSGCCVSHGHPAPSGGVIVALLAVLGLAAVRRVTPRPASTRRAPFRQG